MNKELFLTFLKPIILFIAALYLFGFSLNGVNVLGNIDVLIPFERVLCFCVALGLFGWFGKSYYSIYKTNIKGETLK
jgi:hypothetical protein